MKEKSPFKFALFVLFLAFAFSSRAENKPKFIENKGQYPKNVKFKLSVANAEVFFEQDRLTFNFFNPELLHQHEETHAEYEAVGHAYSMEFVGASANARVMDSGDVYPEYINYIRKGLNVSGVQSYTELFYENLYDGINLHYYGKDGELKYDVLIEAGTDAVQLKMKYRGPDKVELIDEKLRITNSFNTVVETIPLAYQIINGEKVKVACEYHLENETVSFHFPDGYDNTKQLVVDPTLVFSSFSGSTANNFGFTATYDDDGFLYGAGFSYSAGYPITLGAFQSSFAGERDVAVSKFSADGSSLIYSTFIGGSEVDVPHSMIVNSLGQLVILGTTSSTDFPVSSSAYDTTFNEGDYVEYFNNGTEYNNGADVFVSVLSQSGSQLIGSTYLGGSANDGLNESNTLRYNYNDVFRGEVVTGPGNEVYVTASTQSIDFPFTELAYDTILGGGQDAFVAKFSADLSTLEWCTALGGSNDDAGYSLKLGANSFVYVTGGTSSIDFNDLATGVSPNFSGGQSDGFLAAISADGSVLQHFTYLGTSAYDQSYFVDIDSDGAVYCFGQTLGNYPVSSGVYSGNQGQQFIHKLSENLQASEFSTVFGSGASEVNISPTAFLVDICKRIYISGWGGETNQITGIQAGGNTFGLDVTQDAIQSNTDGSDFYFMVLDEDASNLIYATYFGGASKEHVDGGTSRFDRNGVIYQAVCAACAQENDFPTTPGVWSEIDQSSSGQCNLGVIKLAMEISTVDVQITNGLNSTGCAPLEVQFESTVSNASVFTWYFHNGDSSNLENPIFTYQNPGEYEVLLVGSGTLSCTGEPFTDTAIAIVTVYEVANLAEAGPNVELCPGESAQIGSDEVLGLNYSWSPTAGLSSSNIAQPQASPIEETRYFVTVTSEDGCQATDSVLVSMFIVEAFPDTVVCLNDSIQVFANGGNTFLWEPAVGVSNPNVAAPFITAGFATQYTVFATNGTCEDSATVRLETVPAPTVAFDVEISQSCLGDSVRFINLSEGADSYSWNIGGVETSEFEPILLFEPGDGPLVTLTAYNNAGECSDSASVDYMNGWYTADSVLVSYPNVITPNGDGINDCFQPDFHGDLDECFTLKIFSRWGRLLYDSEKMGGNCWDGEQRTDDLVSEGTYYYIATVRGMDHAGYLTVLYP